MKNPYLPVVVVIKDMKVESSDSVLFTLQFKDKAIQKRFRHLQGQFVMLARPGAGEAAMDICSSETIANKYIQVNVKKVGFLTDKLMNLHKGDILYLRGPYGNGWPRLDKLEKANLLLIGGGSGFVSMRGVVECVIAKKYYQANQIQIFYGCSDEKTLLFKDEFAKWKNSDIDINIIFAKQEQPNKIAGIHYGIGLVTNLFDQVNVIEDATAFIVGPPVMYKPVIKKLEQKGFDAKDIYFSLERRMYCGIGICQHCAVNDVYVCKDGPVFNLTDLIDNHQLI